jgi:hypothetical protein
MGEDFVFQGGLGADGAKELVAEFLEGRLIGFGDLDGVAVKGAFELDDSRRRLGRRVHVRMVVVVLFAHGFAPEMTIARRVKRFWRFGGRKRKNIGDFILKMVVNGF